MEREATRALLVVPDPKEARRLEGLLAGAPLFDYRVTAAASPDEARALLARGPWDVVLLDTAPPDGRGAELVRAVRELAPGAAVVALTAGEDEDAAALAPGERAEDCLARDGLDGPRLLRALRGAVERARAAARFRGIGQALASIDRTAAALQHLAGGQDPPPR
jgi:two-component system response regulator PilR (NtrC family)